jgi:FkbM family methyltransferase
MPPEHGVRTAFTDIFLDYCYGLELLPPSISSVMDIGAHIGLFSVAARLRFRHATIHAYEPNPNLRKYLESNAQIAHFSPFYEAVGVTDGRVRLVQEGESVMARTIQSSSDPSRKPPSAGLSSASGVLSTW